MRRSDRRAPRLPVILASVVAVAALLAAPARAGAAEVELSVSSRDIYVGLPFTLSVAAKGFEGEPEPTIGELAIEGCDVVYLGVDPSVSSFVQIVGGRMTEAKSITFVYRYRVTARREGAHEVPPMTVAQAGTSATSRRAAFEARPVIETDAMKLRLVVPDRPVWVGEAFAVQVDWYITRDVEDYTLVVPLFDLEDRVRVEAPPGGGGRAIPVAAGSREVPLPVEVGEAELDGETYTRYRIRAEVTATGAGVLDAEPARVIARQETGRVRRDRLGFRVPETALVQARDVARRIEIRPLPEADRPASWSGAVGSGFTIEVAASRSVVAVGDPIELEVIVRGRGELEGIALPPLHADGGLSPALFAFPEERPPGETLPDGGKRFRVSVRPRSEQARELPPLAFSFFDPDAGRYRTVRSRPIALSVQGGRVVGAGDVVVGGASGPAAGVPDAATGAASDAAALGGVRETGRVGLSLVGADLSLSRPDETLAAAATARGVLPIVVALHLLSALFLGIVTVRRGSAGRRTVAGARRAALASTLAAIDAAAAAPVREGGGRIASALRALRRELGAGSGDAAIEKLIGRCESLAFDPEAAAHPVPVELVDAARAAARDIAAGASGAEPIGRSGGGAASATGAAGALLALTGAAFAALGIPATEVHAEEPIASDSEAGLAAARDAYGEALATEDRAVRLARFARAATLFGEAAQDHPRAPALLTDWGNAALGAADLGTASLAYRRALAVDPDHDRARRNLAFLEGQLPAWLPRATEAGALDSLFFWHRTLSLAERLLVATLAFALGTLLLLPGPAAGGRLRRLLAIVPAVAWAALAASAALELARPIEAVLRRDAVVLRSADGLGAPPAFSHPLPAGATVAVEERRPGWTRITLADGTRGWLPEGSLTDVEAAPDGRGP